MSKIEKKFEKISNKKSEFNRYLISGNYGVGKSHLISDFLEEKKASKKEIREISFASEFFNDYDDIVFKIRRYKNLWLNFFLILTAVTIPTLSLTLSFANQFKFVWWIIPLLPIAIYFIYSQAVSCSFKKSKWIIITDLNRLCFSKNFETLSPENIIWKLSEDNLFKDKNIIFETNSNVIDLIDSRYIDYCYNIPNDYDRSLKIVKENIVDIPDLSNAEIFISLLLKKENFNIRRVISEITIHHSLYKNNHKFFEKENISFWNYFFVGFLVVSIVNEGNDIEKVLSKFSLHKNWVSEIRGIYNATENKLKDSGKLNWIVKDGEIDDSIKYITFENDDLVTKRLFDSVMYLHKHKTLDFDVEIDSKFLEGYSYSSERFKTIYMHMDRYDKNKFFEILFSDQCYHMLWKYFPDWYSFSETIYKDDLDILSGFIHDFNNLEIIMIDASKRIRNRENDLIDVSVSRDWFDSYINVDGFENIKLLPIMFRIITRHNTCIENIINIINSMPDIQKSIFINKFIINGSMSSGLNNYHMVVIENLKSMLRIEHEVDFEYKIKSFLRKIFLDKISDLPDNWIIEYQNRSSFNDVIKLKDYLNSDMKLVKRSKLYNELIDVFPLENDKIPGFYLETYSNNNIAYEVPHLRYITSEKGLERVVDKFKDYSILSKLEFEFDDKTFKTKSTKAVPITYE